MMENSKTFVFTFVIFYMGIVSNFSSNLGPQHMKKNSQNWIGRSLKFKLPSLEQERNIESKLQMDFELERLKRYHPLMAFANGRFEASKISPYVYSWDVPSNREDENANDYWLELEQELRNRLYMEKDVQKRTGGFAKFEKLLGRI